ncbi:ABC exporter ATP-binding subunit, DevA family [Gloeomargarita lithophora Alchichica-D10]|uniref:ABC exporter ATP-binding subunit, DevA family n=1 Tax=Gloeomargarita lithophora Alchichica-D10 TaxID=1188229 RepID=A0A1J0AEM9_9CYAN|nr:DevA family ABC transporter ATP-binding protein [Gloeomargarita lithophora]APB34402.1 ABC exporter ATP-binding subunit, DevA family [Gloeomargarita lithophora Alchichica-D10]
MPTAPGIAFSPPATPLSEAVVVIEGLEHAFGEGDLCKQILFDINLTIRAGEIVILTGPSGSGKTTLLTLIGCLRSVQQGSLQVLEQELNGANKATQIQLRRYIGYIFQAHNLLEFLTARQNVQMALELHPQISPKQAKTMAESMLSAVGLGEKFHTYPHALSGGQKQRVAIARALASHPRLILADEPTAALDSKTGREVVDLMQKLAQEQGCAILLVTHDHRILDIADRIVHLEDGYLVQDQVL